MVTMQSDCLSTALIDNNNNVGQRSGPTGMSNRVVISQTKGCNLVPEMRRCLDMDLALSLYLSD